MNDPYWTECKLQDEVKNLHNETTGTVIAKYKLFGLTYIDVRGSDDKIYYNSPVTNWETVRTEEENFE